MGQLGHGANVLVLFVFNLTMSGSHLPSRFSYCQKIPAMGIYGNVKSNMNGLPVIIHNVRKSQLYIYSIKNTLKHLFINGLSPKKT